jgi:uncharacterized protein
MLAVDTNILVYAHRREVREHEKAAAILRALAEGNEAWAIPWPCLHEFFSVVTNTRIWKDNASTAAQAVAQIEVWTLSPSVHLIGETEDCLPLLLSMLKVGKIRGPVVHDARIAAICVAHAVEALLTRDRDFSLFGALTVRNPLD